MRSPGVARLDPGPAVARSTAIMIMPMRPACNVQSCNAALMHRGSAMILDRARGASSCIVVAESSEQQAECFDDLRGERNVRTFD